MMDNERDVVPVVAKSDVVVVGGGSAGVSAAVSAARNGCSVTLLERYHHLGGMASGGMVLVLDDMVNGQEVTVAGIVDEFVQRMAKEGMAVMPPVEDRYASEVRENNINLRLHSWFSDAIVEDGAVKGVICQTKLGRQAIMGDIVIDTTGDLDVACGAGAEHMQGQYIVTTVFRLANVDTEEAIRFEYEEPEAFAKVNREARRIIGGAWEMWWLKTPIPGVIWCNCPHMPGYDGISVGDLTAAEYEGRERMMGLFNYVRANMPGFEKASMLGAAEQVGVRTTRMLQGDYVVTKDDVVNRRYFEDTVCRGRDYYTPYRALLPKRVDQLIVAGRHYSAEPEAQKRSREIPPCMAQGEVAGIAAALALDPSANATGTGDLAVGA
jgi:ribulose 1,5-bisphosphate synthetase/thiazole synthase